jgi:hypothetical protein
VGQAKRRHVLRYLAARERAGIIGTGPFDLDEALVRLDARLAKGCRWALAVAVELARTGDRPGCATCLGRGEVSPADILRRLSARRLAGFNTDDIVQRLAFASEDPAPCEACQATGHNIHASLPWPAWLRRKGREQSPFARNLPAERGAFIPGWAAVGFEATCENEGERRVETRTRSFARGAHEIHDPWQNRGRRVWAPSITSPRLWPAWLRGQARHAEQRRERAQRSAGKAERARRVVVGYSRELSGSWAAEGSELERWHAGVRDQADALGYAVQPREPLSIARYSTPGPARHWAREPEWRQEVHGEWVEPPPDPDRGTGRTTRMLERAAAHNGPVVVIALDARHADGLRRSAELIGADHVEVTFNAAAPRFLLGRRDALVLWDHAARDAAPIRDLDFLRSRV